MPEPISMVSGGVAITQGALQFIDYVRGVAGSGVMSAYFGSSGERISGSDKIAIDVQWEPDRSTWWFSVKPVEDYVFVRIPVGGSGIQELLGCVNKDPNPDWRYWRWVALPPPGAIVGGERANAKIDFVIVGYKPKALVKHFSNA